MEEKKVETTNSNGDWSDDFQKERETNDTNWFKDAVPEGSLTFKATIEFMDEGMETINNFDDKVIRFLIIVDGEEKTWDVKKTNFDILKTIADNKPIFSKTAVLERTGTTRQDTRRSLNFN